MNWTRVGVIHTTDDYGANLATQFESALFPEINVTGIVSFSTDLDPHASPTHTDNTVGMANLVLSIQQLFVANHVAVFFLATGRRESVSAALHALREAGLLGDQRVVLLPDFPTGSLAVDAANQQYFDLLNGSIGVFPDFDKESAAAGQLFARYPRDPATWAGLMAGVNLDPVAHPYFEDTAALSP